MTKVIASVGAHKTASSLLQHHFKWRSEHYINCGLASLTRDEVSECVGGGGIKEQSHKLANAINARLQESDCQKLFFCFEDMFGKPFSVENSLYGQAFDGSPILADALSEFDTRVVYVVRPQWEFLESFYLQKVHEGYFLTFNQFIEGINLNEISWVPLVEQLRKDFGKNQVDIVDFREVRNGQRQFIEKIVHKSVSKKVKIAKVDPKVHNASISDRGLQLALRINPLLKPGWSEVGKVRKFLQENFSNRDEPRPNLLSEELRVMLINRYQKEYENLVTVRKSGFMGIRTR
ncbi:hypothetical protein OU789_01355 [Halocynthiibacter sp. C4]|uniref:hypothetical protein n=1 Tax=Halocynthiibacter sp. C4 TaxID=2992758 RepID=UPI00237B3ED6|nr:hypothetical protein [Halocynthiibacter sp. C4]MDE0588567.1 hypothetical protein [Halocynthiibacter sp. C4]